MNVIPRTLLLATMCLGFARAAEAQDAGNNPITLPEVSVSAQADGAFFAPDTASQGVVTGKQIEEQPRSRVGEVLEVVPGLIATQHSGEGKANQYFLRGFNLDHGTDIDITLEDMPVNMRTHAHGQGYADLNFMIPELISTLHYSKGPYFPDLGDFDTAAAVQINYVDTLPHDLALPWRAPACSAITAGSARCRVRWALAICRPRRNTCTPTVRGRSRTITTRETW